MSDYPLSAIAMPAEDPSPIFECIRGNYATEMLAAAVAHFKVFELLKGGPISFNNLRRKMGLAERPASVLLTAVKAMGLVSKDEDERLRLTPIALAHLAGGPFDVADYLGLNGQSAGVLEMVKRLKSNSAANADNETGAAFIYREGIESAMEKEGQARALTLALAGRSRNIAPVLAHKVPMDKATMLLDVGGGTGIYSIAMLQKNPTLRAIVWDRPEVLKVAAEMGAAYGVLSRLELREGDMFTDPVPTGADTILLSNILHDWDVPQCRILVARLAEALRSGGRMLIHDALLNDELDGPLPVALYSAALFSLTEGRAYSGAEYAEWLTEAHLTVGETIPTLIHCSVIVAIKP
ncbi:MAG: methyltransferase [Planctomycetota bacterium]